MYVSPPFRGSLDDLRRPDPQQEHVLYRQFDSRSELKNDCTELGLQIRYRFF